MDRKTRLARIKTLIPYKKPALFVRQCFRHPSWGLRRFCPAGPSPGFPSQAFWVYGCDGEEGLHFDEAAARLTAQELLLRHERRLDASEGTLLLTMIFVFFAFAFMTIVRYFLRVYFFFWLFSPGDAAAAAATAIAAVLLRALCQHLP